MRNTKKLVIRRIFQVLVSSLIAAAIIAGLYFATEGRDIPVLDPKGTIAEQQFVLILITVGLGFFVIVPVFILLFAIAWKYRASNKKATYEPELDGHAGLELLWWGIPCIIILMLAVITVITSHSLDPFKPIESEKKPVTIQVISQERNWVFIYPDYAIATVNYITIPEDTPVNFLITADSPMNTFWVPALAGQVYSMSGMTSKLHLMADEIGTYDGMTTNISGEGYADLRFKVNAAALNDFETWLEAAKLAEATMSTDMYNKLHDSESHQPQTLYRLTQPTLFNDVIMKYMHNSAPHTEGEGTEHSDAQTKTDHEGMDM